MCLFFWDALLPLPSLTLRSLSATQEVPTSVAVCTVAQASQGSGLPPIPPYRPAACILPSILDQQMSSISPNFSARRIRVFTILGPILLIPSSGNTEWRFSTVTVSTITTLLLPVTTVNRAAAYAVTRGLPIHLSASVKMELIPLPTAMDKDTFGVQTQVKENGVWSTG